MSLKAQITEDMKTAMRAKDSGRLGTIRLLQAAMKQKEVDERVELDDAAIVAIVDKLIKQRKDAAQQYEGGGRQDLPHSRVLAGCPDSAGRGGLAPARRHVLGH